MKKQTRVNGNEYEIDTTPNGYFATIVRLEETTTSGVLTEALTEIGVPAISKIEIKVSAEERSEVVKALGWNFSKSNAWRETWEYERMKS